MGKGWLRSPLGVWEKLKEERWLQGRRKGEAKEREEGKRTKGKGVRGGEWKGRKEEGEKQREEKNQREIGFINRKGKRVREDNGGWGG